MADGDDERKDDEIEEEEEELDERVCPEVASQLLYRRLTLS